MDQKSTKNQSKMDQTSIKNRPKSSIQNTPADAQPRIYKILLPTPSQAPLPTPSQGYTKSSCRRPERETMRKYGIMGVRPRACGRRCTSLAGRRQEDFVYPWLGVGSSILYIDFWLIFGPFFIDVSFHFKVQKTSVST